MKAWRRKARQDRLHTALHGVRESGGAWLDGPQGDVLLAWSPCKVLTAQRMTQVVPLLGDVETATQQGLYAVGYLAYEAAPAFDPTMAVHSPGAIPLAWMALYEPDNVLRLPQPPPLTTPEQPVPTFLSRDVTEPHYQDVVTALREYIAAGDAYQVNYTFRETHRLHGDAHALFHQLRHAHPTPHAAWLNTGPFQVLSLSPELFLARHRDRLESKPMKGTAPRGLSWREDQHDRRWLAHDPKNRAENVMIVDLVRNDLGRVCQPGSISVPALFEVSRFASVHQMTSTVRGRLRAGAGLVDIMGATFPPGSVTGAPKVRATQLIAQFERAPRQVYCGAVGVCLPGGDFRFNVAIRTLLCRGKTLSLGLGGGIVHDSSPASEWRECATKSRFLAARRCDFQLIATMRLDLPGGFLWPTAQLLRLRRSAARLGAPCRPREVIAALREAVAPLQQGAYRVRLLLDQTGAAQAAATPLEPGWPTNGARVALMREPLDNESLWLRHKTTRRERYDAAFQQARQEGFDEALFCNQHDQVTEGAISGLLFLLEEGWRYPEEACGLLPSVWQYHAARALDARPARVTLNDLQRARMVLLGNAVRGGTFIRELVVPEAETLTWGPPDAATTRLLLARDARAWSGQP